MGGFYRYQPQPNSNQSSPVRMSWQGYGCWGHRNRNKHGLVAAPQPPVAAAAVCPPWQQALFGGQGPTSDSCSACTARDLLSCLAMLLHRPVSSVPLQTGFFFSQFICFVPVPKTELFVRRVSKQVKGQSSHPLHVCGSDLGPHMGTHPLTC